MPPQHSCYTDDHHNLHDETNDVNVSSSKSYHVGKVKDLLQACEENNNLWLTSLLKNHTVSLSSSNVEKSLDVNSSDRDGWTSLHWASRHNNVEMLSSLIKVGGDVNLKTTTGDTPLSLACLYGNKSSGLLLLETKKCSVNTFNTAGFSPLMYACRFNHIELAEALVAAGANVSARNTLTGDDCLALASKNGHKHIIKMLINAGAVEYENSDRFKKSVDAAKDNETRSLLLKEARWFLRKPLLMALTQTDVIESSVSKCKLESFSPATFKPPSIQETVFFNMYREIALYL